MQGSNEILSEDFKKVEVMRSAQSRGAAKRWRVERACLQHFSPSGWVPEIHAEVPETLIAMTCLPGWFIGYEDYVFMLAMGLFYFHIRIARRGTPDTKADYVAKYLPNLRREALRYACECRRLGRVLARDCSPERCGKGIHRGSRVR